MPGFGVRLMPSGRKTWVVQKRTKAGRSIRLKIGRSDELSAEQARDEAKRLISRIALGEDPASDRRKARLAEQERRAAPSLNQLLEDWVADRRRSWRPATEIEIRRQIARHIAPGLGRLRAGDIKQKQIVELHRSLPPIQGNRVVSTIRSAFGWALSHSDGWPSIVSNPATGLAMNPEQKRERFPQNGELQRLVQVLHSKDNLEARFYLLLLLTGARRGEVENARWADFDLESAVWTKPARSTKQRKRTGCRSAPRRATCCARSRRSNRSPRSCAWTNGGCARRGPIYLQRQRSATFACTICGIGTRLCLRRWDCHCRLSELCLVTARRALRRDTRIFWTRRCARRRTGSARSCACR